MGRVVDVDLPEDAPEEAIPHELRKAGVVERLVGAPTMVGENPGALDGGATVRVVPQASVPHDGEESFKR
eukprot:8141431-Alexandrium_andersonii.AAC.1